MISPRDLHYLKQTVRLAKKGLGCTSPNPMVGALVVKDDQILGSGWHHGAGCPHAEIEAFRSAQRNENSLKNATLYVSLEPCSTHGRTPPCTEAILREGIKRVVVAEVDSNPLHAGKGLQWLRQTGIQVEGPALPAPARELNRAFHHWIQTRLPWVTLKSALTLDGKIATASGESQWITSPTSRKTAMQLRHQIDAILCGVETIVRDDPFLTYRPLEKRMPAARATVLHRYILDPNGRTPPNARVLQPQAQHTTTLLLGESLQHHPEIFKRWPEEVNLSFVPPHPTETGTLDLACILRRMGEQSLLHLLVEGGGKTLEHFLQNRLAQEILFFYAPKILGGSLARKALAGKGAENWEQIYKLKTRSWTRCGPDLQILANIQYSPSPTP